MEEQQRSAAQMVKLFEEDPTRLQRLKVDPIPVLRETATLAEATSPPAYHSDTLLYRIAVVVLSALALIAAVGSVVLVFAGKTTPEVLVALGSAAVGALVGLFAPSHSK